MFLQHYSAESEVIRSYTNAHDFFPLSWFETDQLEDEERNYLSSFQYIVAFSIFREEMMISQCQIPSTKSPLRGVIDELLALSCPRSRSLASPLKCPRDILLTEALYGKKVLRKLWRKDGVVVVDLESLRKRQSVMYQPFSLMYSGTRVCILDGWTDIRWWLE